MAESSQATATPPSTSQASTPAREVDGQPFGETELALALSQAMAGIDKDADELGGATEHDSPPDTDTDEERELQMLDPDRNPEQTAGKLTPDEEDAQTEEEASEEDEDSEDEPDAELLKGAGKGLSKRFNQLLAERKETKSRIAALEADLAAAEKPTVLPASQANPLADVTTEEMLADRVSEAKAFAKWARKNPHGGTYGEKELTPEDVEGFSEWADAVLERQQERQKYLADYKGFHAFAKTHFPKLFERDSAHAKVASELLRKVPQLVNAPDYEAIIGLYLKGAEMALAEERGVQFLRVDPKQAAKDKQRVENGKQEKQTRDVAKAQAALPSKQPAKVAAQRPVGAQMSQQQKQALIDAAASGDDAAKRKLLELEFGDAAA